MSTNFGAFSCRSASRRMLQEHPWQSQGVDMLVLSRRPEESFYIDLNPTTNPELLARDLFKPQAIKICILSTGGNFCRIGVLAPKHFRVWRDDIIWMANKPEDC